MTRYLALGLLAMALSCKSGGDGSANTKAGSTGSDVPAAGDAAESKPKPRGWKAYPKERITDTEGMGQAADAEVVGHDGKKLALASTWADGYAILVFYRGHW